MNMHERRAQTLYQLKSELFSYSLPESIIADIQNIESRLITTAQDINELSLSLRTIVKLFDLAHNEKIPLEQLHALMSPYMEKLAHKADELTNTLS